MVDAGVVVVRPAQHHDAEAVLGLELIEHLARRLAQVVLEALQAAVALVDGPAVLVVGQPEQVAPNRRTAASRSRRGSSTLTNVFYVAHAHLGEDVALLGERGLHGLGGRGDGRAGAIALASQDRCEVSVSIIGKKMTSSGFLAVVLVEQVVDVRDADLAREAGVDRAALGTLLVQLLAREVRVDDVLRRDARAPRSTPENSGFAAYAFEHARHADAQRLALGGRLRCAGAAAAVSARPLGGSATTVGASATGTPRSPPARESSGTARLIGVHALLDDPHLVDVLDQAPLARVADDQALDARAGSRSCSGAASSAEVLADVDVDERAQAVVLAEVAARVLVCACDVVRRSRWTRVDADERGPVAAARTDARASMAAPIAPDSPQCGCTMIFGATSLPGKRSSMKSTCALTAARLCCVPPCRTKLRPERGEVRDLADVQPDVLRQHGGEPGHDLLGLPALPLEVDDVRLHEDGAAVAELGHRLGPKAMSAYSLDRRSRTSRPCSAGSSRCRPSTGC